MNLISFRQGSISLCVRMRWFCVEEEMCNIRWRVRVAVYLFLFGVIVFLLRDDADVGLLY